MQVIDNDILATLFNIPCDRNLDSGHDLLFFCARFTTLSAY